MWLTCHELFFKYIKMAYLDPQLHWQCITKCKDGGVAICGRNFILPYIVLVASPGGIKLLPQIATPPSFHSFKQRGGHHKKAIAKRMYSSLHLYCVQGPMWNWRRKFELIYNCGKYFGFTSTYKKYFPVTLSSKSQPSRNMLHEPFFSLSHSVVIDGLLRGLRMPGDGAVPWGFPVGIKSGQSYHHLNHQLSTSLDQAKSIFLIFILCVKSSVFSSKLKFISSSKQQRITIILCWLAVKRAIVEKYLT